MEQVTDTMPRIGSPENKRIALLIALLALVS